MEKKKICFVAQFPPPMHGLSKAVDTLYNSYLSEEFEFEKIDITNNKKFLSTLLKLMKSKAELFYFTISQSKSGNLRDLLIMKLLRWRKKKCLIHLHGGYYRQLVDNDLPKWQRKSNYKEISKLCGAIVLGNSLRYIFEGMIDDSKIFVVPNCVDNEFLMNESELISKAQTTDERKIKYILYLSNFIKSKGYPVLLEMAKLEKERCDSGEERRFHFDFAGKFFEEAEEKEFFEFIKNNQLDDYITYHGIVGGEQKRELLAKCDIFSLITNYPKEGQPISILEAMGNGMYILTTKHAGIPDIVEDGVNGVLLDKNGCSAKDVYCLLKGFNQYKETATTNHKRAVSEFTEEAYLQAMKKVFLLTIN